MLVRIYESTWCNILEDLNLRQDSRHYIILLILYEAGPGGPAVEGVGLLPLAF